MFPQEIQSVALDLNAMAVFAAVVDTGGFTAAAGRLGVSKSVVSKQVSALEERLGTRLLNRTTRRLSPTEAGLAFYERTSRMVAEAEAAELAVNDLARVPRGRLRVNAPMSFGIRRLGPALEAFARTYPEVEIDISLNDRIIDLVEEGFDVAVRIGILKSSSLIARKLCPVEMLLCAAPSYLADAPALKVPEHLKRHRCLVYTLRDRANDWRLAGPNGETRTVTVDPVVTANNGDVLAQMAEAGGGVVCLPDFIVSDAVTAGRLQVVLPDHVCGQAAVHAVYPAVRHLAAKVRVFVDFLAAEFQHPPQRA